MPIGTSVALSQDTPTEVDTNTVAFVLRAADSGKSIYSVAGLSLPVETLLTISHETTKAGNQRHLVRIDSTNVDSLLVPATASVYLVIDRPPSLAHSANSITAQINQLIDFFIESGAGRIAAILNNEV
jgi:hypothetical protein